MSTRFQVERVAKSNFAKGLKSIKEEKKTDEENYHVAYCDGFAGDPAHK